MRRFAPLLLAVLLLAGCGGGDPPALAPPTEPAPAEPDSPPPVTGFAVYFLRGEQVVPVYREVPQTRAVGTAAVEHLLAGPTDEERDLGVTSSILPGARLLTLDVSDGTAAVDLSPEFGAGDDAELRARLAELTFTLTQFPTVERVWVAVRGEPVYLLGMNEPLTRDRFEEQTPLILVDRPALGETVSSPLRAGGTASVFEATLRVRLLGPDGETVWEDTVTASEGAPGRGDFSVEIPFAATGEGTLVAFSPSAADDSEQHTFEVPITLEP